MDGTGSPGEQTVSFRSPRRFLADLDAETMGHIIASAADVALVVDDGVIQDVALGNGDLTREGYDRTWPGKLWSETVTIESRPKIEDLLRVAPSSTISWRQVNHPSAGGADVPVKYTAVRTGGDDRIVALGRDMRSLSRLQQRLVEAHQELERDYTRLREAESRYRLLFRSVSQPVVVVDPSSLEIAEANPAAAAALGRPVASLVGTSLEEAFPSGSRRSVRRLVSEAMSMGSADVLDVAMSEGGSCQLKGSAFRYEDAARVIVQLTVEAGEAAATGEGAPHGRLLSVLEELPDGLIVTGSDLRILAANRAFVEMAHLVSPAQIVGQRLSDFLGRSATELNVLTSNLRNHGAVRNFTTVLRDRFGNEEEVEVSAVTTSSESSATYGLSVRNVARTFRVDRQAEEGLPSSPDQLTRLVGRVPLREIVRQTTDFIEKLCIEAALEVTGDNRASAAEMLGLSRQGLYSKLKRFELDH